MEQIVLGLFLTLLGAVILAFSSSQLAKGTQAWLFKLDFTIETLLNNTRAPIVQFDDASKIFALIVKRTRCWSIGGWLLLAIGTALQIWGAFKK